MTIILGVVIGLLSLGLMMLLHELGHFLVALKLGFKVTEFSIFMGPRLWSKEVNGIRYSLKLFPIGASVQFDGEYPQSQEEMSDEHRAAGLFYAMPVWKRALVIFAGPAVNLVSAFLALLLYFNIVGIQSPLLATVPPDTLLAAAGLQAGDTLLSVDGRPVRNDLDLLVAEKLGEKQKTVHLKYKDASGTVLEKSLERHSFDLYKLGIMMRPRDGGKPGTEVLSTSREREFPLRAGDVILKADGREATAETVHTLLQEKKDAPLKLEIERAGVRKTVEVRAQVQHNSSLPLGAVLTPEHSFGKSIGYSWNYSVTVIRSTFQLLGEVFRGGMKASQAIAGPVGIVDMYSGIVSSEGIDWGLKALQLLYLFALISLSLGFMNLLPLPPLDGSLLLFLLIERVRGKKLSYRAMEIFNMIGMVFILALALLALGFDLLRIFRR